MSHAILSLSLEVSVWLCEIECAMLEDHVCVEKLAADLSHGLFAGKNILVGQYSPAT